MRMLKAIARVRRGAKDKGLEGALSSLGNELRSDAIPERLRDVAVRLATLISPKAEPSTVVALEQALAARELHKPAGGALSSAQVVGDESSRPSAHGADHTGPGVCPFTGMRADGTLAVAPESLVSANDRALEQSPPPAKAAHEPEVEEHGSVQEPKVEVRVLAHEAKVESAVRAPKARAKDKEKLAGARIVENTSARSATRSAPKQPRSRTQRNRKKV